MSASICKFETRPEVHNLEPDGQLHLQAFVGGNLGPSIQFTITQNGRVTYACLGAMQLETLKAIIDLRLNNGISATGCDFDWLVKLDGQLEDQRDRWG